jgi:hypothetical protein
MSLLNVKTNYGRIRGILGADGKQVHKILSAARRRH